MRLLNGQAKPIKEYTYAGIIHFAQGSNVPIS